MRRATPGRGAARLRLTIERCRTDDAEHALVWIEGNQFNMLQMENCTVTFRFDVY